jgi:hypothetical protein
MSNSADAIDVVEGANPLPGVTITGSGASAVMWVVDGRNNRVLRVPFVRPGT